jgi:hypothetical protein
MMINVQDPPNGFDPAIGDGDTDDTQAIQDLIDANLGTLCFPDGKYRIEGTLSFPPATGHHIVGCGAARRAACDGPNQNPPTYAGARAALV